MNGFPKVLGEEFDQIEKIPYRILEPTKENIKGHKDATLLKVIVIGNSGVGKSSLVRRVTTNDFINEHEVTIGVEFGTMLYKMDTQ